MPLNSRLTTFMSTAPSRQEAIYYRVNKIGGHSCNLVCDPDTICKYIKSGRCIPLRRWFRKMMMISVKDPRTKSFAGSISGLKFEERKHLESYFYMIHPFSEFHFYWQTFMTIVHLMALVSFPIYSFSHKTKDSNFWVSYVLFICISSFVNIILSFLIGYHEKNTDKIMLRPGRVAIRYLTTYFLFDLISSVNYNIIGGYSGLFATNWYSRLQWIFRIVRLFTIDEYLLNLHLRYRTPSYIYKIGKHSLFIIVFVLWFIYLNHVITTRLERQWHLDWANEFLLTANDYLRRLFLCDGFLGRYSEMERIDIYILVATLQFAKLLEILLLAVLFQLFHSHLMVTQRYQSFLIQVGAFVNFKDLPKRMKRRINNYLNFRFNFLFFNEKQFIKSLLCPTLKNEILWHKCQNLVTKVATFEGLPKSVLMKLVTMMKSETYLPNDVVVQAGEVGNEMFFIYVGVLAVFTELGREICHLSDGTHFGEIALLLNEPRVASVVAIDYCELYRLTKKDFQEAIEPYPEVKAKILKAANERFKETREILDQ